MQSYGLAQIMGGTARWLGFNGALPALYKPENNLYWACSYLSYLKKKYGGGDELIAAYNAGSPRKGNDRKFLNQYYVDKVKEYYNQLKNG
jgi:soluble lytic murein transglycosylase-like protein